jgi:hypothetical protein
MKKWMKIILIIAAIGIIAALLIYKFYINKPQKDIENASADFTLKTEDLYKEFTTNKKHADSLYTHDKNVIEITGKIDKIVIADSLVIAVFVFAHDDFGDAGIRCTFLPKYSDEAKKITIGSTVKIKGCCKGFNDPDVTLEKCSLVKDDK